MNKQSIVSSFKFAALSLFFVAAISINSFAGTEKADVANATSAVIKYMGSVEDGYVFNVKYDNLTGRSFDLVITDETGEILFSKTYYGKNFSKRFQLSKSIIKATFLIQPDREASQTYEVAVNTHLTEDVVISRQ